mmetsp:Transcript_17859/g.24516  ORF Transcript_17859/g.24516 Transcript_17859/m.24516 type:complete len:858 (+) Transcript_17859:3-2576(+)
MLHCWASLSKLRFYSNKSLFSNNTSRIDLKLTLVQHDQISHELVGSNLLETIMFIAEQRVKTLSHVAEIYELQRRLLLDKSPDSQSSHYNDQNETSVAIAELGRDLLDMFIPLPRDPFELIAMQVAYNQLMESLSRSPAIIPSDIFAFPHIDCSNVTVALSSDAHNTDSLVIEAVMEALSDSLSVCGDAFNAIAYNPVTAVLVEYYGSKSIPNNSKRPSFVQFFKLFCRGLPIFTHLLQVCLLLDLLSATATMPCIAATDDLAIELYCYLIDALDFILNKACIGQKHVNQNNIADGGEDGDDILLESFAAVKLYEDGVPKNRAYVFCGYLVQELLRAMYALFECHLRRGCKYSRALDVLHRIAVIEMTVAATQPSTVCEKVDSCLRALVNSAVDSGNLAWLCSEGLDLPEGEETVKMHNIVFLEIIEDQLRLLSNSCALTVFLPKDSTNEIPMQVPNSFEHQFVFYMQRKSFRSASRVMFGCYEQLNVEIDFTSVTDIKAAMTANKRLLAATVHCLGMLPVDQMFFHIHSFDTDTQSMEGSGLSKSNSDAESSKKRVSIMGRSAVSFLLALSEGVDALLQLYLLGKLDVTVETVEVLSAISSTTCEHMLTMLSRAGCCNLAVLIARQASELWLSGEGVKSSLGGATVCGGLEGSRIVGPLTAFEVAVLHSVRTLNFLALHRVPCDLEVVYSDLRLFTFTRVICNDETADMNNNSSYQRFLTATNTQIHHWLLQGKNELTADRLYLLSLACLLENDESQHIPSYLVHFSNMNSGSIFAVVALFIRYKKFLDACSLLVKYFQSINTPKQWISLEVVDRLVYAVEKQLQISYNNQLHRNLVALKACVETYFEALSIERST